MFKFAFVFLLILLAGCAGQSSKPENRYYSDATDCFKSTNRKVELNIKNNTREGLTIISPFNLEIPVGGDPGAFHLCMEYRGHPHKIGNINPDNYLNVSRACMDEASDSPTPNDTYSKCVERSKITVDTLPPESSK